MNRQNIVGEKKKKQWPLTAKVILDGDCLCVCLRVYVCVYKHMHAPATCVETRGQLAGVGSTGV